jgi:hypothetical protein
VNLRTKIPFIHSALFLGIGLCLLFWSALVSERLLIEEKNGLFAELLMIAANNASSAIRDGDQARLYDLIASLLSSHHISDAQLLDGEGRILAHKDAFRNGDVFIAQGRVFRVSEFNPHAAPSSGDTSRCFPWNWRSRAGSVSCACVKT